MRRRLARGEDGAVLVVVALLLVSLLGTAALVVDLAALRLDRRVDRSATDAAATAGAVTLGSSGARAACTAAWEYALHNLRRDPTAVASPCSPFPVGACNPATPVTVTGTVDAYEITISNPVNDGSALMRSSTEGGSRPQRVVAAADGAPCDRVAVHIRRTRSHLFGAVLGQSSGETNVHSVARINFESPAGRVLPALVALERTGCRSVDAGTGEIYAQAVGNYPGRIYADSTATGGGCPYVFNVKTSGRIHALPGADGTPGELGHVSPASRAFSSAGGNSYVGGRLALDTPVTRAAIDVRYHCTNLSAPCPSGDDAIADLHARYGGSGTPTFAAGYSVFPSGSQTCSSIPATFAAGDWYVNCSSFNVGGTVTFNGNGVIVFKGNVKVTGRLNLNGTSIASPPAHDATVVIRGTAGLSVTSNGTLVAPRTMVLNVNGGLLLQGGPTVHWTAPETGPLSSLLYWTESNAVHKIQGNPDLAMRGIAALPNAMLTVAGNGFVDATDVQVWLRAVKTQGSSVLVLRPDPSRSISLIASTSRLIR